MEGDKRQQPGKEARQFNTKENQMRRLRTAKKVGTLLDLGGAWSEEKDSTGLKTETASLRLSGAGSNVDR